MNELFGELEPLSLRIRENPTRRQISWHHLNHFDQNKTDFGLHFVTMNQTWMYHHDLELKQERKTVDWGWFFITKTGEVYL